MGSWRAKATQWYRKAAEQDYVNAQFALGLLYGGDDDVPLDYLDYAEAAKWFERAAN